MIEALARIKPYFDYGHFKSLQLAGWGRAGYRI